jgi:hypothetical protein
MWHPGKVLNKIKVQQTYPVVTNYWAPLETIEEKDDTEEEKINSTVENTPKAQTISGNKLTRRLERRQTKQAHKIIIDSGATSQFISDKINLPNMGKSNKDVNLPNGLTLTTTTKTLHPFERMTTVAREALVLPGLKKSLASINKWSEEGYTTVFHPGENGVTVHKPDTLTMIYSKPPVLLGHKPRGSKLWTMQIKCDKH